MIVLPPPSQKIKEAVRESLGVDENGLREAVKILKEWLHNQPHLPHNMDEKRLEYMYLRCKASLERVKYSLDMYYSYRTAVPEILADRDPKKPWLKEVMDQICFLPLPQLTEDLCRVIVIRLLEKETKSFNVANVLKMVFMIVDILYVEDYTSSAILVIDNSNVTLGHATKFTPPLLRKLQLVARKAYCCRIKEIHLLNASPYAISAYNLLRTMLNPNFANRFYVHKPGNDTLQDYISPKILPVEYGGEATSDVKLWGEWKKKLLSHREWFLTEEKYKVDESKRPGKAYSASDLFGFEGSFRQLTLD